MKRRFSFDIDSSKEGYTLEEFLLQNLPQYKRNTIRKFIYDEFIRVNEKVIVDKNLRLRTEDNVAFVLPRGENVSLETTLELEVLYEEKHFLVVNKPPNVPVISERWSREAIFKDSLREYFEQKQEEEAIPFIVHRIDKEASGAVVVAKNKEWERYLGKLFEERKIKKKYLAIVAGTPDDSGTIDLAIKQASDKSTRMVIDDEKGKKAVTHYKVIEFFRDFALVELEIESGRTHQIRVHMASQGYPLAIDSLYGYRESIKLSDLKKYYHNKRESIQKPIMSRLTLHAQQLEFFHPEKQENICVTAPLFKDFEILLKHLRKYRS